MPLSNPPSVIRGSGGTVSAAAAGGIAVTPSGSLAAVVGPNADNVAILNLIGSGEAMIQLISDITTVDYAAIDAIAGDGDGTTLNITTRDGSGAHIVRFAIRADGAIRLIDSTGDIALEMKADGKISLPQLPTSDPAVAGALWNSTGTVKVSAG